MDVLEQAEANQGGEHAGAAIGNKWQRHTSHWHQTHGHADIFKGLESKPSDHAYADQSTKEIIRALSNQKRSPEEEAEEPDDQSGTDKSGLLTRYCKNKVGLLFWHKATIGLRAVE